MPYSKTIWATGDVITASKMNNIEEGLDTVTNTVSELSENIAAAYDDTTSYAIGDYCAKDGKIYKCNTAITTGETWTEAHWTEIRVMDEVVNIADDLDDNIEETAAALASQIQNVSDNQIIVETESAAVVHVEDAARAKLKVLEVEIDLVQAGSGDPSPDNIRPISGWTSVNAARTGKNLCPPNIEQGGFDGSGLNDNTSSVYSARVRTVGYIPVKAGMTVVVSATGQAAYYSISGYAVDDYTTARIQSSNWIALGSTCVIDEGVKYIRLVFRKSNTNNSMTPSEISDIQLELGSTATDYEPYQDGASVTYTMPTEAGTIYGGKLRINEDGSGLLTVDMAYRQETADEFAAFGSSNSGYSSSIVAFDNAPGVWFRNFFNSYGAASRRVGGIKALCNAFKIGFNTIAISASQNRCAFMVDGQTINSVESFIETVRTMEQNGGGVYIAYELASPTTYTLTAQQVLSLVKGVNNVYADTGDTAIEYVADTKTYIDNKFAELQALILENI